MSNYLSNLVARNISGLEVIQPRLPSLFEPIQGVNGLIPRQEFDLEKSMANPPVEELERREVSGQMNSEISPISQPSAEHSVTSAPQAPELSQRSIPMPPSLEEARLVSPIYQSLNDAASNSSPLMPRSEPVQPPTISDRLSPSGSEANTPLLPAEEQQRTKPEPLTVQQIVTERTVIERVVPTESPAWLKRLNTIDPAANVLPTIMDPSIEPPVQSPAKPAAMPEERSVLRPLTEQVTIPHQVIPSVRSLGLDTPKFSTTPQPAPIIQVTIGRIEVRATPPSAPSPTQSRSAPSVMSLEDYLRQRGGGR
jgi:hypothetical protein